MSRCEKEVTTSTLVWAGYTFLPRWAACLSSDRRLSHSIASLLACSSLPPRASSSSSPNLPTHLLSASSRGVNTSSSGASPARWGLRLRSERANSSSAASETGSRSSSAAGSRRGETPDLDRDRERNFKGGASDRGEDDEAAEVRVGAASSGALGGVCGGGGGAGAGVGFLGINQLNPKRAK